MPLYESVFIVRQDASSQQVEGLADNFSKIVTDLGGDVPKTEYWGLRSLAYRIKKNRKGHYVLFNINAPYDAVAEMERNMRLNEDILRYMTLRVDELEEGPSIVMRVKAGRDEGSRRDGPRDARDRDRRPSGDAPVADKAPGAEKAPVADKAPVAVEAPVADEAEGSQETQNAGDETSPASEEEKA